MKDYYFFIWNDKILYQMASWGPSAITVFLRVKIRTLTYLYVSKEPIASPLSSIHFQIDRMGLCFHWDFS